jgi:phosphoribosylanthranilate isomerase
MGGRRGGHGGPPLQLDMTFIKICGITNLADALAAVAAGADALGFNFYKPSPRYIAPEKAREIIEQLPVSILTVAVFVNEESTQSLTRIADEAGVTALQLHGDESPDYCRELKDRYVIKMLSVSSDFDVSRVQDYEVEAIMLDTKDSALRGGTGRVFEWSIAQEVNKLVPKLFLAGGLSPENITEAIEKVRPYAIDACSALEEKPGKKNHERMRAFVERVRNVKP